MIKKRKRLISEGYPTRFNLARCSSSSLSSGIEEFLSENFRGAISFESSENALTFLTISPDGLAHFFKVLLNAIFGNSVVNIHFHAESAEFRIYVSWKFNREFTEDELAELNGTAYLSGFSVLYSLSGEEVSMQSLSITMKSDPLEWVSLYATTSDKIKWAFKNVFFLL